MNKKKTIAIILNTLLVIFEIIGFIVYFRAEKRVQFESVENKTKVEKGGKCIARLGLL